MINIPKYKVIKNESSHEFDIGTIVWVTDETYDGSDAYTDGNDYWWLTDSEVVEI